jgi:hypothetical protein
MKKLPFFPQPSVYYQVFSQLTTLQNFVAANDSAKAHKHTPNWDCIIGLNYLAAFLGTSRSMIRRLMKSGQIIGYKVNGKYFFLIFELLRTINMDPQIFKINWESYESEDSPQEMDKIHWRKFNWPNGVLVKYTFMQWTSTFTLPIEMWGKNSKIIKKMIREINKRNDVVPFKTTEL